MGPLLINKTLSCDWVSKILRHQKCEKSTATLSESRNWFEMYHIFQSLFFLQHKTISCQLSELMRLILFFLVSKWMNIAKIKQRKWKLLSKCYTTEPQNPTHMQFTEIDYLQTEHAQSHFFFIIKICQLIQMNNIYGWHTK